MSSNFIMLTSPHSQEPLLASQSEEGQRVNVHFKYYSDIKCVGTFSCILYMLTNDRLLYAGPTLLAWWPCSIPWEWVQIQVTLYLIKHYAMKACGPGSVVGIVTGYRLDGLGIKPQWWRDFLHLSRPALEPSQPPVQWVLGLSQG